MTVLAAAPIKKDRQQKAFLDAARLRLNPTGL